MSRREFFDRHAAGWESESVPDLDERLRRVVWLAKVRVGHWVLDVGTGTGMLIPHLTDAAGIAGRVVAFDTSLAMLREARQKTGGRGWLLVQADAQRIPVCDAQFHRVVCNAALPHFEDRERALREMYRALVPSGIIIVSHPIGREAVNARHRAAGEAVAEDRVPAADEMVRLMEGVGFRAVSVVDEPDFYLARGQKGNGESEPGNEKPERH